MSVALATAATRASLLRYKRSWGLWLLLLVGPIAARYMVGRKYGDGVQIMVADRVPVIDWPVLGMWLGIVTATLLVPAAWIYLRSAITKVQPWQVEDVSPANRVMLALGKFLADAAVLLLSLVGLSVAGFILGTIWLGLPDRPFAYLAALWLTAAPPLVAVAAVRQLFASRPKLRGGLGDFLFFCLWIASVVAPITAADKPSSFANNLADFPGFVRPMLGPDPAPGTDFVIGGVATSGDKSPIPIDVPANMRASGYVAARFAWLAIAFAIAALGGLVYRTRTQGRPRRFAALRQRFEAGPPRPADPAAPPAGKTALAFPLLAWREARLALAGRLLPFIAVAVSLLGLIGDYRRIGSPAELLFLALVFSAQAARSEAKGLQFLFGAMPQGPMVRRAAFVLGGTLLALVMALPAAAIRGSVAPLALAGATGLGAAVAAMLLAALSRGPTAPRIVLLITWYVYFSM